MSPADRSQGEGGPRGRTGIPPCSTIVHAQGTPRGGRLMRIPGPAATATRVSGNKVCLPVWCYSVRCCFGARVPCRERGTRSEGGDAGGVLHQTPCSVLRGSLWSRPLAWRFRNMGHLVSSKGTSKSIEKHGGDG